jgi:hypothetical protein
MESTTFGTLTVKFDIETPIHGKREKDGNYYTRGKSVTLMTQYSVSQDEAEILYAEFVRANENQISIRATRAEWIPDPVRLARPY